MSDNVMTSCHAQNIQYSVNETEKEDLYLKTH